MPRRNDAVRCYDIPAYNQIYPFMMKERTDSLVFHEMDYDVTNLLKFVKKYNREHPEREEPLKTFEVILAGIIRILILRPGLNRFIAQRTYWQRNEVSINFVVKQDYSDDSPEHSNPLYFTEKMGLEDICKILEDYIAEARAGEDTFTDYTINTVFRFVPKFLVSALVGFIGFLDRHGHCPQWVRDADGLHTSIFIANLGSIGVRTSAPHHHLYKWGTTSVFCILGPLNRVRIYDDEGKSIGTQDTMKFSFTVDERITDGFYFLKSLRMLAEIFENPEVLIDPPKPEDIPHLTTKEEYKAQLKKQKAAKKAAAKAAKAKAKAEKKAR